jgi:predicted PurR-regulated permease PerM
MRNKTSIAFLLALTAVALYLTYRVFEAFLSPIFTALALGIAFFPLFSAVHKKVRGPGQAALLTIAVAVLAVLIPAAIVGNTAQKEMRGLIESVKQQSAASGGLIQYIQSLADRIVGVAGKYVDVSGIDTRAQTVQTLQQIQGPLLAGAGSILGNVAKLLLHSILVLFVLYFLFADGNKIRARCARLMLMRPSAVDRLFDGVRDTIQASMLGILVVAVGQGVLIGLAMWLLGVPAPVFWSTVTGLASLIPVVGTAAIWVPASIWLIVAGSWVKGLILLAWGVAVATVVDNVLRPYVVAGKMEMHPGLLLIAILGGVEAFGVIGIVAGPVVLAITQTLFEILSEELKAAGAIE